MQIDNCCYYGIQTQRALSNFSVTDAPISTEPELIVALAMVKYCCAQANQQLGVLGQDKASAIMSACQEVIDGNLHTQFVVGVIQGGA